MKRKFEEESNHNMGDGMSWWRGKLLGKGGFGSVYLANSEKPNSPYQIYPSVMAVKSSDFSESSSLQKEKEVFNNLYSCPYILQCYGEETTFNKNGDMFYNLLLEYASGGTLASLIKQSGGGCGLHELDVKRFTNCILQGIYYIHRHGYVHCDLKPENVLLVGIENCGFVAKIADFGLAKKRKMSNGSNCIGGTTRYMAPETVVDYIQESPCDIWALGCIVYEMFTGKKVWDSKPDETTEELTKKIGHRFELPVIPSEISKDGKDFLKRCLVKKPEFRFTAEMLLDHPFLSGLDDIKSIEFEILDEGCVSNADNEFDDSSCSANWSSSEQSSLEETDDRLHCSFPEFIEFEGQESNILIPGQNLLEVACLLCR